MKLKELPKTKVCTKCGQEKSRKEYYVRKRVLVCGEISYYYNGSCRDCNRIRKNGIRQPPPQRVDAQPFVEFVRDEFDGTLPDYVPDKPARRFREARRGSLGTIKLTDIDKILTSLDLHEKLDDLYPIEEEALT